MIEYLKWQKIIFMTECRSKGLVIDLELPSLLIENPII